MKKTMISNSEKHQLLLTNRKHYLWNKHYHKWTEEDIYNITNGINTSPEIEFKPTGNKARLQAVKMKNQDGTEKTFKSVAEASRKSGVSSATIYADVNGHRILKKIKYPLWEKVVTI